MALALASKLFQKDHQAENHLPHIDEILQPVCQFDPQLANLAADLADAVWRNGYNDKGSIRASIDECIRLTFEFSGDPLDIERDLVMPQINDPEVDKYPQWFSGTPVGFKHAVARIMAKEEIPSESRWSIAQGTSNSTTISFESPKGTNLGSWVINQPFPFDNQLNEILRNNESAQRNLEKLMANDYMVQTNTTPESPQSCRYYMAGAARFLTAVREAEWLAGENPFAYAFGNPIVYSDPSGNAPAPKCKSTDFPPACQPQWLDMITKFMNQYCVNCPNLSYET